MLREQMDGLSNEEVKDTQKRADILCFPPTSTVPAFNIDVAIVWPHQAHFEQQNESSLPHLKGREKSKNSHYEQIPELSLHCYPYVSIPFVIDTYGNLGEAAHERLKHLVSHRVQNPEDKRRGTTLLPNIIAELQAALHRAQYTMKVKAFHPATQTTQRRAAYRLVTSAVSSSSSVILAEGPAIAEQRPELEQKTEESTLIPPTFQIELDVPSSRRTQIISNPIEAISRPHTRQFHRQHKRRVQFAPDTQDTQ